MMRPFYKLNERYFSRIDTADKAYFLGLLYADGYMHDKRKYIYLSLQEPDKEILEKFSKKIQTNKPLLFIKSKKKNVKHLWRFSITRVSVYNDLKKLGLYQKKSLTLTPDKLKFTKQKLVRDFIRGYFDGDGSFSWSKVLSRNTIQANLNIVCTKEFVDFFSEYCREKLKVITLCDKRFPDETNCYNFRISGNRQVFSFLSHIYENSEIKLKRKYEKYIDLKRVLKNEVDSTKFSRYEIIQKNSDGRIVDTFPSILSAAKAMNIPKTTFRRKMLHGLNGYIWEQRELNGEELFRLRIKQGEALSK